MEASADPSSEISIDDADSSTVSPISDHDLFAQLESLRHDYHALRSKSSSMEESLRLLQQQRGEAIAQTAALTEKVHESSVERDFLRRQVEEFEVILRENEEGFAKKIDEESKAKVELEEKLEFYRGKVEELESETKVRNELFEKSLDSICSVKESLVEIIEILNDEKEVTENVDGKSEKMELEDEELWNFAREVGTVLKLAREANSKAYEFKEARKKEKRELEGSVNRDINSLLRIALVEKEAVEKNLNKLKGNTEQKRVALLHIAERGLQRVGFGFMMGSGSNEQATESSGAFTTSIGSKSNGSECEEEVVSLASTVEKIMKNLRLEISQLRRSLEESSL
ncbi:hypothetical protein V6Z11_D12G288000 [Gossypium hirsutum]